ncbi:acyl--CoA ligase family protein [Candidatus Palauibacter sp.]|uniref:acyl--CoA ligase family protein n=1 Tax=Candidatus Palauibacter sp. TaxID=3101350 RepID=UPI003B5C6B7B
MSERSPYRTELTPLEFLRRSAFVYPDKAAVVHGDRSYSYREFELRVRRLAAGLLQAGLAPGERVAFLSPNTPPLLEAHYGVPAAGGVLVAINTRLGAGEIAYILEHSGARYLFVDRALEGLIDDEALRGGGVTVVRIDDTGAPSDPYEAFLASAADSAGDSASDFATGTGEPPPLAAGPADEEAPISMNYTSGTTGRPKGVVYTHRGAYLNAIGELIEMEMTPGAVYLWTLPMFHCNGWCFTWAVTAIGGTHVCLRDVDPARIWALIESEGVTHYCGAPTVQIMLVNDPAARPLEHTVRTMIAGAPPSPTLLEQLKALNFHPIHAYGLTETYGPTATCAWHADWDGRPRAEQARLLARQGQGFVTSDLMRVVDEEGSDVPRDGATMGEVVMRGNIVMKGYYAQPEATDEAFRGGWFHSGDLAVWHPDGYVELRDRAKDIIISGGENISTIEVEQTVARHPAVLECAVIAIPHDEWGERPKAFVTLKPDAEATDQEIIDFCRDRIAHFKCPDAIDFGPLPKTSTGKVQKYILRDREWTGRDKRIN